MDPYVAADSLDIWKHFLKDVKGIGPLMAGVIVSEYDIYEASTVSKMWQFTGLNPGMVRGRKLADGEGDKKVIIKADEMVRGDKLTPGFLAPFNKWLRTKMCGVLGASFLKASSPYAEIYYNEKTRLENSDQICETTGKL